MQRSKSFYIGAALAMGSPLASMANDGEVDYFSMSLEELGNIEITSVSKRSEKASEVAAAVHVITQDDIERSGATSIPEALRLAPGVNVARAGAGQWAISIRGFNAQFTNKLLVLIDGRSVYTPLFAGVFWDIQDTLLEDIERIEVIRGPGGTIWGANAVNGVINIITKEAKDTQGSMVAYQHGLYEQKSSARYGGNIGDTTHYRAFVQQKHHRELELTDGSGSNDALDQWRAGMRVDMDQLSYGNLSISSELYQGSEDLDMLLPSLSGSFVSTEDDKWDVFGGHILANWEYSEGDNQYSIKGYYDLASRDTIVFENDTQTFDIDFNHSFGAWDAHDIIWGLGYRLVSTDVSSTDILSYTPGKRSDNLFSAFIQDKISLYEDEAFLTLGSKFEHNDYTGFEWQPSARLSWLIDDKNTIWGSVSRAVRTPSRASHDLSIAVAGIPSSSSPTGSLLFRQIGNEGVDSEELVAYEAGYRSQISDEFSIDIAAFYNDYNKLASDSQGAPFVATSSLFGTHAVLPFNVSNDSNGETFGVEVSADWQLNNDWKLSGSYSALEMDIEGGSIFVSGEGRSPHHQFNLETHYTPNANWEWDMLLYYVDELNPSSTTTIPDYWRFDTRVAYNFDNGISLSLVGQNLFDDRKQEFSEFVYNRPIEIPRTVYGRIGWKF